MQCNEAISRLERKCRKTILEVITTADQKFEFKTPSWSYPLHTPLKFPTNSSVPALLLVTFSFWLNVFEACIHVRIFEQNKINLG